MKKVVIGLLLVLMLLIASNVHREQNIQQGISEKILRFHVLANSDSDEDQEVKLKVRDGVGIYVEELLEQSDSRKETEQILNDNMDEIIDRANEILNENGMKYQATARIAQVEFPDKTYGRYTFPAGNYRALQIKLGKAAGHNWWCVLYPNLCFRGTMYEEVDDAADEKLKEVLSAEEYKDIIDSGEFEIKFKFLEYLSFTR